MDGQPYHNQSLFSEYYLQELVRDDEFWKESLAQAQNIWKKLRDLYWKVAPRLSGANEAETERLFIRSVLDTLGHLYALQATLPSPEGPRRPDFAFFATDDDLREAERLFKGKVEFFKTALAVGDAKHWDRSLDKKLKGPGDPFTNQNPSYQIDYYLRVTNCRWGILTNGRLFRLYNRDTSYRFDVYYEIDLPALLEWDPFEAEAFTYFVAFFRKEAFVKGPGEECFFDRAYRGSVEYAAKLGEELKDNVYEALQLLAEGLLKYPPNHLSPDQDLDRIRENAFVLIYRILFTLYAEDRGLLPLAHPDYQSYSLKKLAREVAEKLDQQAPLAPTTLRYWSWLIDLFRIINEGDPYLGVPPYNGGLFDDEKHPFLRQYKIGDSYLAQAIDHLTRAKASGRVGRGFVSYRDLEIRHLGSIYEGLLEHRLRVAPEDIAVVKEDRAEKFVPLAEVGKRKTLQTYQAGQVYLETDKGERKATGSYYTPDYIVKYIVQHTLGPVLEEKTKLAKEQAEARQPELESLRKSIAAYKAQMAKAATPSLRKSYEEKIKAEEEKLKKLEAWLAPSSLFIEEILKVKVLDPAMGSGHFLVEATDYLARALIEALGDELVFDPTKGGAGITKEEPPLYGSQPIEEEDIRWARREVVEKCIYGVDLNPLAVELAKLSLWLYTVAKNRPLNFLDHHLRCGNSLIGARIHELGQLLLQSRKSKAAKLEAAGQISTFEHVFREKVHLLLRSFELIETLPSETVQQIRQKDAYYQDFRRHVQRFKEVADLWTSLYFGNEVTWEEYRLLQEQLRATDQEWEELKKQPWFVNGLQLAEQKRLFHWELEFPEVFYEGAQEKENPGFDVVVGNPPYFLLQGTDLQDLLRQSDPEIFSGSNDISHFFLKRTTEVTSPIGYVAFIITRYWLEAHFTAELRRFLSDFVTPRIIVDFGNLQVWPDVNVLTIIAVFSRKRSSEPATVYTALGDLTSSAEQFLFIVQGSSYPYRIEIPVSFFGSEPWHFRSLTTEEIWQKVRSASILLDEITVNTQGIKTGNNEAFTVRQEVIDAENLEKDWLLSLVQAQNIQRYEITDEEEYIIYADGSRSIDEAKAIKTHLMRFRSELSNRAECNKGQYPWWRLQRARDPKIIKSSSRILVPLYSTHNRFFVTEAPFVGMTDVYIIVPRDENYDLRYLSAVLNSRLLNTYHRSFCKVKRAGYLEYSGVALSNLPVRRIAFTTPSNQRARLLQKGKTLYERCLTKNDQACVLGFVEHCLKQEPEQADVVHDLLAFLAEQMIEMNKQKQEEIKGFIGWLEREIGVKVNDLKQKTKIREYHEGSFEDLVEALKENRKVLAVDPSQRAFQDRLRGEFEGSLAKLQLLKERLTLTDRLIDQIVYQLYGLTDEEIQIIEGSR